MHTVNSPVAMVGVGEGGGGGGGGRGVGDGVGSVSIELQSLPLLSNTTRPFNTQALSLFTKQDLFTGQMSV